MDLQRRGRGSGRRFGSAAPLLAQLLLVGVPLLLFAKATRAGEYSTFVTPKEPVVPVEEPRNCDNSLECSCQSGEGRAGAEIGGGNDGFERVGTGSPGNMTPKSVATDPVALFTGGFHHEVVDLELPGVVPIRFIRRYDSRSTYDSPLGFGWSFNYDMRLYRFPGNSVVVRSGCGDRNPYHLPALGVYELADPERGSAPALVEAPPGTFTLTYRSGERAVFGAGGRLEKLEDPQGNRLEFEYLPEQALQGLAQYTPSPAAVQTVAYVRPLWKVKEWTQLEGYTGRVVTLEYSATTGRVTRLVASDGRIVEYFHQDATLEPTYRGNLTKVKGLENLIEAYRYEDVNGDPHNLTNLVESEGVASLSNDYDTKDRVAVQQRGNLLWAINHGTSNVRTVTRQQLAMNPVPPPAITTFTFDAVGHLTQKIDALGNRFDYERLPGSPFLSHVEVWNHGPPLILQKQADLEFDTAGNLLQREVTLDFGEKLTENWTYDHNWVASYQIFSSFDPAKIFRTEYTFYRDPAGRPTNVMEIKRLKSGGGFETTLLTYDGNGQLETITPPAVVPAGLPIRRSYYGASDPGGGPGLLKSVTLGPVESPDPHLARIYTYDARGRLASMTDAKDHTTSFVFDARGRLTSTTNALDEQTLFTYRGPNVTSPDTTIPGPHLVRIERGLTPTHPVGRVTRLRWNVHGELEMVERQKVPATFEAFASYTYDSEGRRTTAKDALEHQTTFGWDALGRLTSVKDPALKTTEFGYDAVGNRTRVIDAFEPVGRITDFVYNAADRLVEVRALGPSPAEITGFDYDAAGNVELVTDPKDQATAYAYDALSRLKSVTQALGIATPGDPDDFTVRYEYDGRGRLQTVTNARGQILHSSYFAWGGLEKVVYDLDGDGAEPGEREVSYTYDLEGHVTSTTDTDLGLGVAGPLYSADPDTGYDALGRLRELDVHFPASGSPRTLTSTYNRFGEREQLDLAQGAETLTHTWTYDSRGRLDLATFPGSGTPIDFKPFDDDALEKITRPSGTTTDFTYFPQGPLETITVKAGGTDQVSRLAYAVNPVQNITNLSEQHATSDPIGAYVFGYDGGNRLTSANYPAAYGFTGDETFGYDPAGNRDDDPGVATPWSYDANNRLVASPSSALSCYDGDGNLTSRRSEGDCSSGTVTDTLTWDAANRLRAFTNSGTTASYAYDPFGRRIKKTVSGATTWYLWDGDHLVAEYDDSGTRKVRYAYAGGFAPAQVAYKDGAVEDVYDVHSDHLDTPKLLTNASGAVAWRAAHEAFGKASLDAGNDVIFNVRFPGQYFDDESGLHYNRFRTYDPSTGRYISADPIGQLGGPNLYDYAGNSPISYVDPFGLDWFRPVGHPYAAGREGTIVEPGPLGSGAIIDDYVPAGHTFADMHDEFVGAATEAGVPDAIANIPSMLPAYIAAVALESSNSLLELFGVDPLPDSHVKDSCRADSSGEGDSDGGSDSMDMMPSR